MLIDSRENKLANTSGLAISFFIFLCFLAVSGIFGSDGIGQPVGH